MAILTIAVDYTKLEALVVFIDMGRGELVQPLGSLIGSGGVTRSAL